MSAADNTMRVEFEGWASSTGSRDIQLRHHRIYPKAYADGDTQARWAAWQAARAGTASMVADAVAAEREACAAICDTGATYGLTKQRREGDAHCASIIRARSTTPDAGEQR